MNASVLSRGEAGRGRGEEIYFPTNGAKAKVSNSIAVPGVVVAHWFRRGRARVRGRRRGEAGRAKGGGRCLPTFGWVASVWLALGLSARVGMAAETKENGAEIYTYEAGWLLYAMNWSCRRDQLFRLAVGSFREEYNNTVEVIKLDDATGTFRKTASFAHPYPATKIMWIPDRVSIL